MHINPSNKYKRVAGTEVLAVYYGENEEFQPSIYIKLKNKPKLNIKSKLLNTNVFLRKDKFWVMEISLLSNKYIGVFKVLAEDLISTVLNENIQQIAEKSLVIRYNEWQNLFDDRTSEELSFNKIQGLIGELYFLDKKLINIYGAENAVKSWIGPLGANQDFRLEDIWYEVKTKSVNKEKIYISNQNQFDSNISGFLVVVNTEKTSYLTEDSVNLIELYESIIKQLKSKNLQEEFKKKLAYLGFVPNDLYTNYNFYINSIVYYSIDETFPRLESSNTINPFINVKYELYLPSIKDYKYKEERDG